jgi:acyl-homoserine lactone acylase PvdQ
MVAATTDNHICYQQLGNNAIRPSYRAGRYVKDGTTSKYDWKGMMPAEDRLSLCDHYRGFFVVSNNQAAPDSVHGGYFKHSIFTARADRL